MTNIDPFAPGDSPQHPSNQPSAARPVDESPYVQDAVADIYQWQRDHFTAATEADADLSPERLQERHERYAEYLDLHGSPDENGPSAEFIPFPVLMRRAVLAEHDDDQHDEWKQLFEQHATDDERDPMWIEGLLPDLGELHARASVVAASAAPQAQEELPAAPRASALKEEWVEYALAVEKARGGELTAEQADAMTVADLKAAYKPQADA